MKVEQSGTRILEQDHTCLWQVQRELLLLCQTVRLCVWLLWPQVDRQVHDQRQENRQIRWCWIQARWRHSFDDWERNPATDSCHSWASYCCSRYCIGNLTRVDIQKGQIDQYIKREAMLHENMQETYSLHNSGDLFYVIALVLHQLPGKVDPRRWHYQRNRDNAAARMRR